MLHLLRRYDSLSRADIARHCGLSEGTISRIAAELIAKQLICEDGEENSTGGRPATRLRLDQHALALGVDVHRWETRFSLATLSGRILESSTARTPAGPAPTLDLIADRYLRFRDNYGASRIEGLGVSIRGLVNSRTGVVELGNIPSWIEVGVRDCLESRLDVPVYVDNNVRLAAFAEYHYGNLIEVHNSHCLLFVMVDEGIGTGLVIDGKLYYGPQDAAGEFGQMIIADIDQAATHNSPGCLEQLASTTALCERYAALAGGTVPGASADTRARVRRICQRALNSDPAALEALRETCRYLSIGIANVIWGLNADAVVIDSTMNDAWPLIAPMIASRFPKSPEILNFRNLALRPASLGGEGSIIGAAALPFQGVFTTGEALRGSARTAT